MAEEPQVRRGEADTSPGQGEQLPMGETQELNEALADIPDAEEIGFIPEGVPGDVEFTDEDEAEVDFQPGDEDEEVLFADPQGLGLEAGPVGPVPESIIRHLPQMRAMLADPGAPASLRAAYRLIVARLEEEMRNEA